MKISILIPAYNEESTIKNVIESIALGLKDYKRNNLNPTFEMVVLDDGSKDNTYSEILGSDFGNLQKRIIRNGSPSGIAAAFEKLYDSASGDWVILVPGDHQWRVDAVVSILDCFSDHSGLAAVSSVRVKKTGYSLARKITSFLFSLLARIIVKNKSRLDPGSVKLVPNFSVLDRKFRQTPSNEIERLILAKRITGRKLQVVEVSTHNREKGKSSSGGIMLVIDSLIEYLKIVIYYSVK